MKILTFNPEALRNQAVPEPAAEGPPEYAITLPVPSPEGPGKYVLLTVTPDGRTAAVLVDGVTTDERMIVGWFYNNSEAGSEEVVTIPKEAPWMLLKRELVRFITKDEARKVMAQAYRGLLGGESCPVHGETEGAEPLDGDKGHGTYL